MWITLSSFGLLTARNSAKSHQSGEGPVSSEERLRDELARSYQEKVKREKLTAACVYFMGGYREDRAGVLLEGGSDRMRGDGNNL